MAAEWVVWVGDDFEVDGGAGWIAAGVEDGTWNTPKAGELGTEEDIDAEEGDDDDLGPVGVAAWTVAGFAEQTHIAELLKNRRGSSLWRVGQGHLESVGHDGGDHNRIAVDGDGGGDGGERGGDDRKWKTAGEVAGMGDPCTVEGAEHAGAEDWDSAKAAEGHMRDAEDESVGHILVAAVRRLGEGDRSLEGVDRRDLKAEGRRRDPEEDMASDCQTLRGDGEDGRSGWRWWEVL